MAVGSIDLAPPGGINSFRDVSWAEQCPGSTAQEVSGGFGDDVAQYLKQGNAGLLQVRNQAYNAAAPNTDISLPGFQDSDPIGS